MRLWIVTFVALAFALAAFGQSNSPPVWGSFDGPNVVYAGTHVIFGIEVSPGDGLTVELIAGPFKGEKAVVKRVDSAKEEITVELYESVVPIPITVRGDNVRVVEKFSDR